MGIVLFGLALYVLYIGWRFRNESKADRKYEAELAEQYKDLLGTPKPPKTCSFCGRQRGEVKYMVEGKTDIPKRPTICDRCVKTCKTLLANNINSPSAA